MSNQKDSSTPYSSLQYQDHHSLRYQDGNNNDDDDTSSNSTSASTSTSTSSTSTSTKKRGGNKIKIFGRIRPNIKKKREGEIEVSDSNSVLRLLVPKDAKDGYINNQKERYKFQFDHIFTQQDNQAVVFDTMAKGLIDSVLEGYNGTIFAYGQTGSGKTFTITGGADRYEDRGIIPRSLSYLFSEFSRRTSTENQTFKCAISYLEIYMESGYDLLDPSHEVKGLEDLPKVSLMEDEQGRIHLKNLRPLPANTEEEALNLLFLGDTNRMIAETPMNHASSRSHCIFTVYIESRCNTTDKIKRSKLHLVDLAGSERIKKSGVSGGTLRESKYINLSLHYLESVIVALHEKSKGKRVHVPYRNSMMTSVLRDSLGGNCQTAMVATLTNEWDHMDESMSTARFAQRVALISNAARVNEEEDPAAVIARLRAEISMLREALARARAGASPDQFSLTNGPQEEVAEDERKELWNLVHQFIEQSGGSLASSSQLASMIYNPSRVSAIFEIFWSIIMDRTKNPSSSQDLSFLSSTTQQLPRPSTASSISSSSSSSTLDPADTIRKLKAQLTQRDNEINILVNMVKKHKDRADSNNNTTTTTTTTNNNNNNNNDSSITNPFKHTPKEISSSPNPSSSTLKVEASMAAMNEAMQTSTAPAQLIQDRRTAFEKFRSSYSGSQALEETKKTLEQKCAEAKSAGIAVQSSKTKMNSLIALIEQLRVEKAMQGLVDGGTNANGEGYHDPEEERNRALIEKEKIKYKANLTKLRALKPEVQHLHLLLDKQRTKLQRDFETWYDSLGETVTTTTTTTTTTTAAAAISPPHTASKIVIPTHPQNTSAISSIASSILSKPPATTSFSTNDNHNTNIPDNPTPLATISSSKSMKSSIDSEMDAEIQAFYQARSQFLKRKKS